MRTNKIPRQVPEQPWYMHPVLSILVGGVLPFGAVFIELYFILTAVWTNQVPPPHPLPRPSPLKGRLWCFETRDELEISTNVSSYLGLIR